MPGFEIAEKLRQGYLRLIQHEVIDMFDFLV